MDGNDDCSFDDEALKKKLSIAKQEAYERRLIEDKVKKDLQKQVAKEKRRKKREKEMEEKRRVREILKPNKENKKLEQNVKEKGCKKRERETDKKESGSELLKESNSPKPNTRIEPKQDIKKVNVENAGVSKMPGLKVVVKKKCAGQKSVEEKRKYEREKKRRQREKMRSDPELYAKYVQNERIQNKKRKESGKIKSINEMSKREQRVQRKKWRVNSMRYAQRKKKREMEEEFMRENSPPPEILTPNSSFSSANKNSGRKRVRRDRSKVVRELEKTKKLYKRSVALTEKWKKRYYKKISKTETSPSPRKRVESTISKGMNEVRKKLLFAEALDKQLRSKAQLLKSHRDKQTFYKCLSGTTLKKYRCLKEARGFLKRSEKKYRSNNSLRKFGRKKSLPA